MKRTARIAFAGFLLAGCQDRGLTPDDFGCLEGESCPPVMRDGGTPLTDGGARDAGSDVRDGGTTLDAGFRDAGAVPRDGGVRDGGTDAGVRDGGDIRDGGSRDGGPCVTPDPSTVALYNFTAGDLSDVQGVHHGTAAGSMGALGVEPGPTGCGDALSFGGPSSFVIVDDHDDFDLPEGTIDFWVKLPPRPSEALGILSRESQMRGDGDIGFFQMCSNHLYVRLQSEEDNADIALCSTNPLDSARWYHVMFDFGGGMNAELIIDNTPQVNTGTVPSFGCDMDFRCGINGAFGIRPTSNDWTIGADQSATPRGSLMNLDGYLTGGAIDELHIRDTRPSP